MFPRFGFTVDNVRQAIEALPESSELISSYSFKRG